MHPMIALRYGLGVGLGIIQGEVLETDYQCPSNRFDLDSCTQQPDATAVRKPLNIPPVVPIVNVILGVQYHPHDQVAINLDAGLQTALFIGISVDFFFQKK